LARLKFFSFSLAPSLKSLPITDLDEDKRFVILFRDAVSPGTWIASSLVRNRIPSDVICQKNGIINRVAVQTSEHSVNYIIRKKKKALTWADVKETKIIHVSLKIISANLAENTRVCDSFEIWWLWRFLCCVMRHLVMWRLMRKILLATSWSSELRKGYIQDWHFYKLHDLALMAFSLPFINYSKILFLTRY